MYRPVHFEILGEDPGKLATFYESVFGWTVATPDGPEQYWLLTTGAAETAGIDGGLMQRHFDQPVINTISVDSLDAAVRRVEEAGGTQIHGPHRIPGVGLHAYCSDPEGIIFGVLEPDSAMSGQAEEEEAA